MASPPETHTAEITSHTVAWMRRIDERLDKIVETLTRHEQRQQRIDRDAAELAARSERSLAELKIDMSSMEARFLQLTTDFFKLQDEMAALRMRMDRIDARLASVEERMDRIENSVAHLARAIDAQTARLHRMEERLDGLDRKLDMILQKLA